jgi:hypothetical protein
MPHETPLQAVQTYRSLSLTAIIAFVHFTCRFDILTCIPLEEHQYVQGEGIRSPAPLMHSVTNARNRCNKSVYAAEQVSMTFISVTRR